MLYKFILLIAIFLPFQLALNPAEGIDLASIRVLALLIFFLWLADSLKNKSLNIGNKATAMVIIFLFANLFSVFFAENINWSIRKLLFIFSIFPLYFAVQSIIDSQEKKLSLIKALVVSGALASFVGIGQFFSQFIIGIDALIEIWSVISVPFLGHTFSESVFAHPSWLANISGETVFRATSTFPDPHMFSFFLGLLFPFSLGLFFCERKKIWLVTFFLILLANILTFSRGGYIGLIAGIIFVFFMLQKISVRYRLFFLLASLTALLIVATPSPVSQRLFSSFNIEEGSNQGRLEMWQKAAETIADHPFFGVGIGNFPLEVDSLARYRTPIYAHNTYLDIAAETGLLGLTAWLGIIFFSLKNFLRKSADPLAICGAVSLIIFSFHSIFETGLYSPVVLTLLLIILATSNLKKNHAPIS